MVAALCSSQILKAVFGLCCICLTVHCCCNKIGLIESFRMYLNIYWIYLSIHYIKVFTRGLYILSLYSIFPNILCLSPLILSLISKLMVKEKVARKRSQGRRSLLMTYPLHLERKKVLISHSV